MHPLHTDLAYVYFIQSGNAISMVGFLLYSRTFLWLQNKPCDFFYCGFELRWEFLTAQVEDLLISQNAQLNEQEGLEMFLEGKAED